MIIRKKSLTKNPLTIIGNYSSVFTENSYSDRPCFQIPFKDSNIFSRNNQLKLRTDKKFIHSRKIPKSKNSPTTTVSNLTVKKSEKREKEHSIANCEKNDVLLLRPKNSYFQQAEEIMVRHASEDLDRIHNMYSIFDLDQNIVKFVR